MTADDELMIKQWHEENERWCMFFQITHTKKLIRIDWDMKRDSLMYVSCKKWKKRVDRM
jgi:hypothetical protein